MNLWMAPTVQMLILYQMHARTQILLKEGDILYIPRGYVHEAHTTNDVQKDSAGLSLHLTLAIEVEAPFE